MLVFLTSAILAGALFQLALINNHAPGAAGGLRWSRLGLVDIEMTARFVAGAKVALRTAVFLIGCFVLYQLAQLFGSRSGLPSPTQDQIVSLALGLIFGPVFVSWISAVARAKSDEPIGWGKVAFGSFLALFFIVGVFGQDAGKLIRRYAETIKGVKFGDVELSFGDARAPARPGSDFVLVGLGAETRQPPGTSAGLEMLSQLAELIARDCYYAGLVRGASHPSCPESQTSVDSAKATKAAADTDAVFRTIADARSEDEKCDRQPSRTFCHSTDIAAAHLLARHLVVDYAVCLSALYQNGTESTFINARLSELAGRYRELLHFSAIERQHFELRAVKTFREQSKELIRHLRQSYPQTGKALDAGKEADINKVNEACQPLDNLFCPKLSSPSAACDFGADGFFNVPENPKSDDTVKTLVTMFTRQDFKTRPYAVTAAAQTFAYLRDYETAVYYLDGWLRAHAPKADEVPSLLTARINPLSPESIVYMIRARITMFVILEEWIRVLQTNVSDALREQHILNLDELIKLQALAPKIQDIVAHQSVRRLGPARSNSLSVMAADRTCQWADARSMRLFANFQLQKQNFAYHALRHTEYREKYAETARQFMAETVDADLGCVQSPTERTTIRADALDLYARIMLRQAVDDSQRLGAPARQALLEQALDKALLGRALVASLKANEDAERIRAISVLDKISVTKAVDTDASLKRTIEEINAVLKQERER